MNRTPSLIPEIMVYFGLRKQPFAKPENPTEIYPTENILDSFPKVERCLLSEDKLVVITGSSGMGNSVFTSYLCANSSPHLEFFKIQCYPSLNATEILLSICRSFEDREELASSTREGKSIANIASSRLFNLMKSGKIPVILLDQAQTVSPKLINDILRYCEAINGRRRGLVKVVLVYSGKDERGFIDKLKSNWISSGRYERLEASALKKREAKPYLLHCMKGAGLSVVLPISEQALLSLYTRTEGNIGELNRIVVDTLNSRASTLIHSRRLLEDDDTKEELIGLVPIVLDQFQKVSFKLVASCLLITSIIAILLYTLN